MKLKCTIGSHGFVGGPTYREGDEYKLKDEELAKQIIKWGYAEEVKEESSSVSLSTLIERDEVSIKETSTIKEEPSKRTKTRKKY